MTIHEELLPYHSKLKFRNTSQIDTVVLHCTELPTLQMAREFGEQIVHQDSGTGNSGHYYIDRDGSVFRYAEDTRVANHVIGHNENSIGIELVNLGRYPNWFHARHQTPTEPYAPVQLDALKELLHELKIRYPQLRTLARHSDLDTNWVSAEDDPTAQIRRKIDPGPLFPWDDILAFWNSLSVD
jgi:N-acetylmuramoyl-L-alanine amidase